MRNWKRLGAISLSAFLLLAALSGCQGQENAAEGGGSASAGQADEGAPAAEPMNLTGVEDPYLALAALPGDTLLAMAGGTVLYMVRVEAVFV